MYPYQVNRSLILVALLSVLCVIIPSIRGPYTLILHYKSLQVIQNYLFLKFLRFDESSHEFVSIHSINF